jgi:hypothetical protein
MMIANNSTGIADRQPWPTVAPQPVDRASLVVALLAQPEVILYRSEMALLKTGAPEPGRNLGHNSSGQCNFLALEQRGLDKNESVITRRDPVTQALGFEPMGEGGQNP